MGVRILLVDDHPIVREGIRHLIVRHPEFRVVTEVGDGLDVIPMVKQHKPDVVILDLALPGLGGIEITRRIQELALGIRVIILSRHSNVNYVATAIDAGAIGYVDKHSAPKEIIEAIHAALAGERYLSPSISVEDLRAFRAIIQKEMRAPDKILTPRERQVMHLVAEGLSSHQIAQKLGVSSRTVEVHRANLLRKLKVRSTAELVSFSIEHGILPPK